MTTMLMCQHGEQVGSQQVRCALGRGNDGMVGIAYCARGCSDYTPLTHGGRAVVAQQTKRSCGNSIERWAGLRWYGRPMPVRWCDWLTSNFAPGERAYAGCGCTVLGKSLWWACRVWWRQVVQAFRAEWSRA